MKIAVIGPGAMGLLYGAKLSQCEEVTLFGNNEAHIREINQNGVTIKRDGKERRWMRIKLLSDLTHGPCNGRTVWNMKPQILSERNSGYDSI